MHCRSCELLIEDELKKIPEIKKVKVNYKSGRADIFHKSHDLNFNQIKRFLQKNDYDLGEDGKKPLFSKNPKDYKDFIVSLIILVVLYFVLKSTGITNFKIGSGNPSGLGVVILVGLTAGFSTCMALVGGLILGITARHAEKHPDATPLQKFRPHLYFNLGRIFSYIIFGALLGLFGSFLSFGGKTLGSMTILVGFVMLLVGLQLTKISPRLSSLSLSLPSGISKFLGINRHKTEYSHRNSVFVGALTFFLPCGFTQAMQLYAVSTGKPLLGAAIMGFFALGTAPGLLSIGGLTSFVKGAFAQRFFKFAGLAVIVFALFNVKNGINLAGLNTLSFGKNKQVNAAEDPNVKQVAGTQEVRMKQVSNGYKPNKFTIKKDIPVKWIITSEDPYSCAASIYSSKIGVRKYLEEGENTIEFTPKETGTIKFSCSMGMYGGKFEVVDSNSNITDQNSNKGTNESDNSSDSGSKPQTQQNQDTENSEKPIDPNTQIIKATYTLDQDIQPKEFNVKANLPVRFEIDVKESGEGCMSSIKIAKLAEEPLYLEAGETLVFEFTPESPGQYAITCAMGAIRGVISVN